MAGRAGRRRFGTIRRLASGRFQASFVGPDGQRRNAPETFATKSDAGRWLTMTESAMISGTWIDLERGKLSLQEYGQRWIEQRPGLRPSRRRAHRLRRRPARPRPPPAADAAADGRPQPDQLRRREHKHGNVVERLFNRMKYWRTLASRFYKHAVVLRGSVVLAAIVDWLR